MRPVLAGTVVVFVKLFHLFRFSPSIDEQKKMAFLYFFFHLLVAKKPLINIINQKRYKIFI